MYGSHRNSAEAANLPSIVEATGDDVGRGQVSHQAVFDRQVGFEKAVQGQTTQSVPATLWTDHFLQNFQSSGGSHETLRQKKFSRIFSLINSALQRHLLATF